jgi:hypothetical protein
MLTIYVPDHEFFNDLTNQFYTIKGQEIKLEHSLVSVAKWESRWHKPFLTKEDKTRDETIDYIKCMTISQNVNPDLYLTIDQKLINKVVAYIEDPMTATTFSEKENQGRVNREVITAEIIYFWMVALNVPFECQKWHLNRLLTLINICNIKNKSPKKMTRQEIIARNRALNADRRAKLGTSG